MTKPYTVLYEDNTMLTYDLTEEDMMAIRSAFLVDGNAGYAVISIGILVLKHVRSIIEQKVVEPAVEDAPALPFLTAEEYEYALRMSEEVRNGEE